MIKQFLIYPVREKKSANAPDLNMVSVETGDDGKPKYTYLGVIWKKEKNGNKYLSGKMTEPYNGKVGYGIEEVKAEETKGVKMEDDAFNGM